MRAAGDGGLLVAGAVLAVNPPTLLVLRALGLGDLLTAVPALRGLRSGYPDHRVVLAAPASLRELVQLATAVDDLLPTAPPGPAGWPPLDWLQQPPAVAVNLHGKGPQSSRALRALRPTMLLTHANRDEPGPEWEDELHEVHRWCRLLGYFGISTNASDLRLSRPRVPSPAPGAVIVHPGCAFAARQWPVERYATVARQLADAGRRVVVTGNAAERELANHLAAVARIPEDSVLAGRTTLSELAALVADATLVVCGDTGIAHLATAYGTPSVVLFGPVSPQHWGPPPGRPQHVALWAGSTGDTFADQPDPGLLRITTAEVIAAAELLIDGGCPPEGVRSAGTARSHRPACRSPG